jgi:hypothetical protein
MRKNTGFQYGEILKVSKLTGFSYKYVCDVLVLKRRKNDNIQHAADAVVQSRVDLMASAKKFNRKKIQLAA